MGWRAVLLAALTTGFVRAQLGAYERAEVLESPRNTEVAAPRIAARVLLIVVDGLRADTAFESGCMPRLRQLARAHASGVALATEITMTGVGVKALGGGVSSGLGSIARNWSQPPARFDQLFHALVRQGGRAVLIGNHTWSDLFGADAESDAATRRMTDLFHYISPVYGTDIVWARRAIQRMAARDWDLAVVHLGGLDNAAHMWTPSSPLFCDKAQTIDRDVAQILDAAGPATTAIVTSDHGSSDAGHHGSGEPEARRTPLVLLGPGFVPAARLSVSQLDVAPTIAALLGLPIPAPAEGRVLVETLDISHDAARALAAANLRQQQRYAGDYAAHLGVAAPVLTQPGQLGSWIASLRVGSFLAPLGWALALAACAASLFVGLGGPPTRPSWRAVAAWVGGLALLESGVGWWRVHNRAVEIAWSRASGAAPIDRRVIVVVLAAAAGCVAARGLRRLERAAPAALVAPLLAISAAGDSLLVPAALALLVAILTNAPARWRWPGLGALALVEGLVLLPRDSFSPGGALAVATPIAIAVGTLALLPVHRHRRLGLLVVGFAAAAVAMRSEWLAARWLHLLLAYAMVMLASFGAWATTRARGLALGGVALLSVALLSDGAQLPSLLALAALLAVLGRALDGRGLAAALLALVATRLLFVQIFEGELTFSHLEINLGYLANPGQDHLVGAATIACKLLLPLFAAVAWLLASAPPARRRQVLAGAVMFFAFRLLHITLSTAVARGTFYSAYADAGHLVFHLFFFLGAGLLLGLDWLGGLLAPLGASRGATASAIRV